MALVVILSLCSAFSYGLADFLGQPSSVDC